MPDFNAANPPVKITNPGGAPSGGYVYQEFPRQMHKFNEASITVLTEEDKAARIEDGWALQPVLKDPKTWTKRGRE